MAAGSSRHGCRLTWVTGTGTCLAAGVERNTRARSKGQAVVTLALLPRWPARFIDGTGRVGFPSVARSDPFHLSSAFWPCHSALTEQLGSETDLSASHEGSTEEGG